MLSFDYAREVPALKRLITLSQRAQWNAEDVDWSRPLSRRGGEYEPVLEWHGLLRNEYVQSLAPIKREQLGRQLVACEFSQILHGEQAALMLAGQLTSAVRDLDARIFAAGQARDEARHVQAVKALVSRLGPIYPCGRVLLAKLDDLLHSAYWAKQVLGLQLFLEARALLSFRQTMLFVRDPVFLDATRRIERDEAHHVAFGIQYLKTGVDELGPEERQDLLGYARHLYQTIWTMTEHEEFRAAFEEIDLDFDACFAARAQSFMAPALGLGKAETVERMHHQFSAWFARSVRRVGLADALDPKERGADQGEALEARSEEGAEAEAERDLRLPWAEADAPAAP